MPSFSHLHCHTQFSLLDGAANISELYKKAAQDNMPAMAITDHGNMFGVFKFVAEAGKHKNEDGSLKVKPIIGCEFYLVDDRSRKQFTKDDRDVRYHQLLLAKNATGYQNLVKLCSLGYIEGLYGKYPRIDKELLLQYHEGLMATSCCLAAEVPRTILRKGDKEAEEKFKWWLDLFGEDYYVELQRHNIPEQQTVNDVLLRFAKKYKVRVIASNDSHYVNQEDWNAHDILLCLNTGEKQSTPSMKEFADDDASVKGKRFAFYNSEFYFKTTEEMSALFADVPEALDNTAEIVGKVEPLQLKRDILLPHFTIPDGFASQDEYLKDLTFRGAHKRYGELTPEIEERINFELFTIKTMGFAGYFLIVADFINHGRDIGVFVGPGRGSAAGSVVAYCTGITNIDPIKYNLLFERFLNPDRKSMPDIDTDFDDEGRQKVIDYVVDKYGRNQVAQIVTYGTMAAKSSIKDVARVMDLPLPDSNALAKLVPERPGIELARVLTAPIDGEKSLKEKEALSPDEIEGVKKLRTILKGDDLAASVLREALVLEGSVRGTGIHAAGIIIAPKDLTEIIPVATSKETDLLITQFDGKVIEDSGVIKMDFLGLKTLTIIRDTLKLIRENRGIDIAIDEVPLDDPQTLELYQRGETNGTFQFESAGMQKYLKDLKPDQFDDLIAMNALFRPGPLAYIPEFIDRKHGRKKITYDIPGMEEYLKDTYGITVYQEQVMLLSQSLAGFTKGDADVLRKAMGKKDRATLDKMKDKFIAGTKKNGLDETVCEKVWKDWEAFAQYAFNKSHSTCYAFVAFQTAYLKAHYPAEYMSAVLTHNLGTIEKITFFMEECRRMGIRVLGPDVNESAYRFSVNAKGEIRFGLGAIKGVGEAAVEAIIEERKKDGPFQSIFDLVRRVNLRSVNRKTFESMAQAGAFDSFEGLDRGHYFLKEKDDQTYLERLLKYGAAHQQAEQSPQHSLFGEATGETLPEPSVPQAEGFNKLLQLKQEREVLGFYISGHPLDQHRFELQHFCSAKVQDLKAPELLKGRDVTVGGMISTVNHRISKSGKPFGSFTLEDFTESHEIVLFGEDYVRLKQYMSDGYFVYVRGKVQERYYQPAELEFKVSSMGLLSELRDKSLKNITVAVPLKSLSNDYVERLSALIAQNQKQAKGKCALTVKVLDTSENLALEMLSRKFKVTPDNSLIEDLEKMAALEFS
jgi:DNA polymerase-3 subunit alpha